MGKVEGPPATWRAQWIWTEGDPAPQNFYLYCRKTLILTEETASAPTHVTADSRYKLYVNGVFVGRGPARSDQRRQSYDTYDLAPFLRVGENVIAVVVHQFGVPTGSYTLGRGGFLLQGHAAYRGAGRVVEFDTDGTWRVLPAPPWERDTPRVSPAIMWMEIYDARREPLGWQRPGYDDSGWRRPVLLGRPPVVPWERLVPRDIPPLLEEERLPVAILDRGLVEPGPPSVRLVLSQIFGSSGGQVAYLVASLRSPAAQRAALSIQGVGPPLRRKVWINGVAYLPAPPDSESPGRALIEFPLAQGWNELLIKVARDDRRWSLDLTLGPAAGHSYQPVEWYSDARERGLRDHAWLAGPYGDAEKQDFETVYDVERVVLSRAPGTPVSLPAKLVPLRFAPGKNVAVTMAFEPRHSQPVAGFHDLERLLRTGEGPASVSTPASGGGVYVTLDFGTVVAGYVRLRLRGIAGGIVDLGYSEKLLNGHVDTLRGEFPWNFADRYVMRDGPQEWELFFWKGFRYLQLTFRQLPEPVAVDSVSLVFTSYPVQYRGVFRSSDPLLNKIWEVGRWTLRLNMHDAYEDTPWREQSQWVGDAQVSLSVNYATFGDVALGSRYLRQIAQGQSEDGALPATYPAQSTVYPTRQPLPPHALIPTFMAQWVSTLLGHYRYTGERTLVSELFPSVIRLMAYFDRYVDAHGLLADVPGFVFLDWMPGLLESPKTSRGELTGLNCLYYRALLDSAELAALEGDGQRQAEWSRRAEAVRRAVNDRLWSEERGVYVAGRIGDRLSERLAVHDSVLAVYSGVAPPERAGRSLATAFALPPTDVVQIATPYFYFFYLQALRRIGGHQEALDVTRRVYGKMLSAGATTWWEHLGGYASLSHAWSSAPTFDLTTSVLGIEPTAPAFAAFRVEPHPGDLRSAAGSVPTVRGEIAVEWERDPSTFELRVRIPMAARVELSVPAVGLGATRLTGDTRAERGDFRGGRARYWVTGPGSFRVESSLSEPGRGAR